MNTDPFHVTKVNNFEIKSGYMAFYRICNIVVVYSLDSPRYQEQDLCVEVISLLNQQKIRPHFTNLDFVGQEIKFLFLTNVPV